MYNDKTYCTGQMLVFYYVMTFRSFKNTLETAALLIDARLTTEKALMRLLHWLLVKGTAIPVESSLSRAS